MREATVQRLKALEQTSNAPRADDAKAQERLKTLQALCKRRLELLASYEKAAESHREVENPDPTPEAEAATLKATADRARATLSLSANDPSSLLPEVFRASSAAVTEKTLGEMKDAITAAQDAAESLKKAVDELSSAASRPQASPLSSAKSRRDEIRQRIAALGPRSAEAEAVVAAAATDDDRDLARDRQMNLQWEARVESRLLKQAEARIDLETRRGTLVEPEIETRKLEWELAKKRLDLMQKEFRRRVELQQFDLKRASASEGERAEHSADPLERFRALRAKELLDEQAILQERELELSATPAISLAEETAKADKSAEDFVRLKKLVSGGRSSGLVAQRLNNSYRRLALERAAIVRNDLAQISVQLARYENELTSVELDKLNDSWGDHALRDDLIEDLSLSKKTLAIALFQESERKQDAILEKRRDVLTKLAERADHTRQQVLRRLSILDDQHGFVRTHLFWVRDMPPLGPSTIEASQTEAGEIAKTLLGIASQPWSRSQWQRITTDFLWSCLGLLALPWVTHRLRKTLRGILDRERLGLSGHANPAP